MYNPFFSMMQLTIEAQKVIELRLVILAWGGSEGRSEAQTMISEKIDATIEATGMLMRGGSHEAVLARYRERIAANTKRLTGRASS